MLFSILYWCIVLDAVTDNKLFFKQKIPTFKVKIPKIVF